MNNTWGCKFIMISSPTWLYVVLGFSVHVMGVMHNTCRRRGLNHPAVTSVWCACDGGTAQILNCIWTEFNFLQIILAKIRLQYNFVVFKVILKTNACLLSKKNFPLSDVLYILNVGFLFFFEKNLFKRNTRVVSFINRGYKKGLF